MTFALAAVQVLGMLAVAPAPPVIPVATSSGVRTIRMDDRSIEEIRGRIRHSTILVFPRGENVTFAAGGDVKGRWVMESASSKAPSNIFSLKPARFGAEAETNLNITTSTGGNYSFRLTACDKCVPDTKVFVEHIEQPAVIPPPDPHLVQLAALEGRVQQAEFAERSAIAAERLAQDAAKNTASEAAANVLAFRQGYPLTMSSDYAYKGRNKNPFLVRAIWHDSERTFIEAAGEVSSIYAMRDGKPEILQFSYNRAEGGTDGTYVIDRVLQSGYLAVGKKAKLHFERIK